MQHRMRTKERKKKAQTGGRRRRSVLQRLHCRAEKLRTSVVNRLLHPVFCHELLCSPSLTTSHPTFLLSICDLLVPLRVVSPQPALSQRLTASVPLHLLPSSVPFCWHTDHSSGLLPPSRLVLLLSTSIATYVQRLVQSAHAPSPV